jgi:all-trans-8'-apo-beta-carotenal 15,15'-oxygenase
VRLPYGGSIHDFGLSPRYAVFYVSPYVLDMAAVARGGASLLEALHWQPERGSTLLVVARESGEQVAALPVGRGYCLHFINCFEDGDRLTVDLLRWERPVYDQYQPVPDLFGDIGDGRPVRFVIDTRVRDVVHAAEIDYGQAPDFASIDPRQAGRPYDTFWMLGISTAGRRGRKFFDQLARADWGDGAPRDVYQAARGRYLAGEPVFIPDPDTAKGGAVMCQLFDAERHASAFGIFDAFDVARGPVAQLTVPGPVHAGFHAAFYAAPRSAAPE